LRLSLSAEYRNKAHEHNQRACAEEDDEHNIIGARDQEISGCRKGCESKDDMYKTAEGKEETAEAERQSREQSAKKANSDKSDFKIYEYFRSVSVHNEKHGYTDYRRLNKSDEK
jgi:hypothetical protein